MEVRLMATTRLRLLNDCSPAGTGSGPLFRFKDAGAKVIGEDKEHLNLIASIKKSSAPLFKLSGGSIVPGEHRMKLKFPEICPHLLVVTGELSGHQVLHVISNWNGAAPGTPIYEGERPVSIGWVTTTETTFSGTIDIRRKRGKVCHSGSYYGHP